MNSSVLPALLSRLWHQKRRKNCVLMLCQFKLDIVMSKTRSLQEHCLMGIKGTVRRSTDGDFIHANVDIDLIITEEPEMGNVEKPVEIFHIIEHFCLGRRRLHLFGRDSTIRPGEIGLLFVLNRCGT